MQQLLHPSTRHHHRIGDENSRRQNNAPSHSAHQVNVSKTARKSIFAAGVDLDSLLALKPAFPLGHPSSEKNLSSVECHATLRALLGIVLDLLVAHQVRVAMHFLEFIMGQDALDSPLDSQVDWGAEGLFPSAVDFGRHEQESFSETLIGMYTTLTNKASSESKEQKSSKYRQGGRSKTEDFEDGGAVWGGSTGSDDRTAKAHFEPKGSAATEEEDSPQLPGMMALLQKRRHTLGMQALGKDLLNNDFLELSKAHDEKLEKDRERRHKRKHAAHDANPPSSRMGSIDSGTAEKAPSKRNSKLGQSRSFELHQQQHGATGAPGQRELNGSSKKAEDEGSMSRSEGDVHAALSKPMPSPCISKSEGEVKNPPAYLSRQVSWADMTPRVRPEPEATSSTAPAAAESRTASKVAEHDQDAEHRRADVVDKQSVKPELAKPASEDVTPVASSSTTSATEEQPRAETFTPVLPTANAASGSSAAAAPDCSSASSNNADAAIACLAVATGSNGEQHKRHSGQVEVHFKGRASIHECEESPEIAMVHRSEGTEASSSGLTCTTTSSESDSETDEGDEAQCTSDGQHPAKGLTNGVSEGEDEHVIQHPCDLPMVLHKSEATNVTDWTEHQEGGKRSVHAKTSAKDFKRSSTGILADIPAKMTKIWDKNLEEDRAVFLGTPSNMFIIHPSSTGRMTWDAVCLVVIMMEAIILPLGLCFDMYPHVAVLWLSTCVFIPDICLAFFTGFYHNGVIVMRQSIIVQRYVLSWFFLDFLSTMPWEVMFEGSGAAESRGLLRFAKLGKLLRVLRLLRVLKLKGMVQRVEEMFCSYMVLFVLSITKTILFFCLIIHWIACLWGWIGNYEGNEAPYDTNECEPDGPCEGSIGIDGSPWRRRYGLIASSRSYQYLTSLQFATGLLTGAELPMSAGYWVERMFVILMMIFGFLMCSTIISTIVVIMAKINQDNQEYLEETRAIRDFMVARGMPLKLQTKVKRYLEYQFKSRKIVHQNHEVMHKLSPFLRLELTEHMNRSVLEHHPFFARMEPALFSEACCLGQSVLYAPGDIVVHKGRNSSSIVFLVRGQLEIQEVRNHFSVFVKPPAWIGDRGLFVTSVRHHNVVCSMHSELLTIRQHDLLELLEHFPQCEVYIAEYCERIASGDPSVIFCEYCHESGHDLTSCDTLTALAQEREHYDSDAEYKRGFLKLPKLNNLFAFSPLAKNGGPCLTDITGSTTSGAAAKAFPARPVKVGNPLRRADSNVSKSQTKYDAWEGDI